MNGHLLVVQSNNVSNEELELFRRELERENADSSIPFVILISDSVDISVCRLEEVHCDSDEGRSLDDDSDNEPSTAKLVDMLAKREGVKEHVFHPYDDWHLSGGRETNVYGSGPARILVVTD